MSPQPRGAFGSQRRDLLERAGLCAALVAGGLLASASARAAGQPFEPGALRDALRSLGGVPRADAGIVLDLPDVADNGAIVPVTVSCTLAGVREIAILVESNPEPLVARFMIPDGTEPFVSTRVKMAASGRVVAIVRADGQLYAASRDLQVTVGGCG
jgi:sulfur-oxidizing protein SoxY